MTLEFEQAVKVLDEHIEVLKQNLLFLAAERKPESMTQIITIKRELDKAVQERMKLSQIYCRPLFISRHNNKESIIKRRPEDYSNDNDKNES
jgi:hypothetical protein